MLERTLRMNKLFDFYHSLLTKKQRQYTSLYYLDDYSLGEIANKFDISRQAVYDHIKRTELMLEEYESKLQLLATYEKRAALLAELKRGIEDNATPEEMMSTLHSLFKLN